MHRYLMFGLRTTYIKVGESTIARGAILVMLLFCRYIASNSPRHPEKALDGSEVSKLFCIEIKVGPTLYGLVFWLSTNTDMPGHTAMLLLSRSTAWVTLVFVTIK
jgi:hypothetical protein